MFDSSFELFISAFVGLFVVVDPFGTTAVFTTLSAKMERAAQVKTAYKAFIIAVCLIYVFCFAGQAFLGYMNISLPAFRIAGGLLLFVTAFRMVMGFHDPDHLDSEDSAYADRSDIAVFPMAIPLLAGPGTMAASLMFITTATSIAEYGVVLLAALLVQLIALAGLLGAGWLNKFFGHTGNSLLARVMGILLTAMSVQFVVDGIKDLITG